MDTYDGYTTIAREEIHHEIRDRKSGEEDEKGNVDRTLLGVFRFKGKLLGKVEEHIDQSHTVFRLYRTSLGKYICAKCEVPGIDYSAHVYQEMIICDQLTDVVKFFGEVHNTATLLVRAGLGAEIVRYYPNSELASQLRREIKDLPEKDQDE